MKRFAITIMLLFLGAVPTLVTGKVFTRTAVVPEEAWVGQRVVLQIDVLSDSGWTQIAKLGAFDLPGAYVMRTESQGTRLQETIDGVAYSGQRYELSIYPQMAGSLEVPAIPVTLSTKTWGANAGETVQQTSTPTASLTAKVPPGAAGLQGLISTTQLNATQTWEPALEEPKVGDAIKRRISLQAADVSAMAFMPLAPVEIPGVGIYVAEPTVKDVNERGSMTGSRTELVTYVLERAGEVQLPDITLSWWNITEHALQRVELPGRLLKVAAGPGGDPEASGQAGDQQVGSKRFWLLLSLLLAGAYLLMRYRKQIAQRWRKWRKARNESEAKYFRRALKSLKSTDANAALRDVMRWLDRINDASRPARLDHFLQQYADTEFQQSAVQFTHHLTAGDKLTDTEDFRRGLSAARSRWQQAQHRPQGAALVLPTLNGPELSS